jgi:hypothetical protein
MSLNPQIMAAVEQLGYRVTNGDVATKTGLHLELARQGLLALAADAGGHLQVTDTGEIVYVFSRDFRQVLRRKFIQIQLREWAAKIWNVIFYIIRISFGIVLIISIGLIYLALFAIAIASIFSDNNNDSGGGNIDWNWNGNFFSIFDWGWYGGYNSPGEPTRNRNRREKSELNFLEAVFSFLFGDGNPNANLEQRRWQCIGNAINSHQGVVIAEQIAPYLDTLGVGFDREYENYMLPVLTKFNGFPEVNPTGAFVYHFPDLQTTAKSIVDPERNLPLYLKEKQWKFSRAKGTQIGWSIALGIINLVGAIFLGGLLFKGSIAAGSGLVGFVSSIFTILLLYAVGFIAIPIGRYLWIQWQNQQIDRRNQERSHRVLSPTPNPEITAKLEFARQFAKQQIVGTEDIIYTTETNAIEQSLDLLDE